MLMTAPTPAMMEQWRKIWNEAKDRLKPNRRTGAALIAYLQENYTVTEFSDPEFSAVVSDNITLNAHSAAKLPEGILPRPRTFWVENTGKGHRLYENPDAGFEEMERIFVGIDEVTGEFCVELNSLLWDELFAFRGLDAADLENCYLVAEYVACTEKAKAQSRNLQFHKASIADLALLVRTRIQVLRAANQLDDTVDLSEVEAQSRRYYQSALQDGSHTAYLVFDGDTFVGAGGVSFYQVMPTCHNPSGRKAYIMNMYTAPSHRRQGIARRTLELLVNAARANGVTHITLEATEMGRKLYEAFGFIPMEHEMILPEMN